MSARQLVAVIRNYNFWPIISAQGTLISEDITTLTQHDADLLFDHIDRELGPENLTCDGELPPRQVAQKHKQLTGASDQLKLMGFKVPANCYEIR